MPQRRWQRTVLLSLAVGGLCLSPLASPTAKADPALQVTTVVSGLYIPWDLTWVGEVMLYDQRGGEVFSKRGTNASLRVELVPEPRIFAEGEGGLLGLVADPQAGTNRQFFTCQAVGTSSGGPLDVRVLRWRLASDSRAELVGSPVVSGLPLSSGRHSGCRLRFGADGKLYVGTGDAAIETNPQSKSSLGGKVLRVNSDGSIPADNPFYSQGGNARYVWTYGHRNVQGLALRPGTSQLWSAEHGSYRDDEVNLIAKGANYGWDPGPGYDESVPMTDLSKFPAAKVALWSSGTPTVATSGLTFIRGSAWGRWQGAMAVGLLRGQGIRLLFLNPAGQFIGTQDIAATEGYGRIRTVQLGPDGALYFTTSNGSNDIIGKIRPTATPVAYRAGLDVSPVAVSAARTGSSIYAFVRSTDDRVYYRRSDDDGRTWAGYRYAGVSSSDGPAVASSASGRIDLFTTNASGNVIHTWFVNGTRAGQANIAGIVDAAPAASSMGDKTLDVFVRSPAGVAHRNHFDGAAWSGWRSLGGVFTSALGASANTTTKITTVTGRGKGGGAHEQSVTVGANGFGWTARPATTLWSARALGDTRTGVGLVAVSSGSDANAAVERGDLVQGVGALYNSAPDVVTRPDGSWIMFGRSTNGGMWYYDARPGGYRNVNLGGIVR